MILTTICLTHSLLNNREVTGAADSKISIDSGTTSLIVAVFLHADKRPLLCEISLRLQPRLCLKSSLIGPLGIRICGYQDSGVLEL